LIFAFFASLANLAVLKARVKCLDGILQYSTR